MVLNLKSSPNEIKTGPCTWRARKARPVQIGWRRFNKQGCLHLGSHKVNRSPSPHLPTRKVHIEALTLLSHMHSMYSLNNSLQSHGQFLILDMPPSGGIVVGMDSRVGKKPQITCGSRLKVNCQSQHLDKFFQQSSGYFSP